MFSSPNKKFLMAVRAGDAAGMQKWLSNGADIDTRNAKGETALRLAVMNNDIATARFLIDRGANPNVQNNAGLTPLSRAAGQGYNAILKLLLAIPHIDVDLQNDAGDTPLRLAAMNNQVEAVRLLLEKGAAPDIQNHDGNTPLIRAAAQGYGEIVRLLLDHGANPRIRNNALMTAEAFARDRGQAQTLRILREHAGAPEEGEAAPAPAAEKNTAEKDAVPATPDSGSGPLVSWHVTDTLEIARVSKKAAIGKEITEIFNFRAERVITIIRDLAQNSEAVLEKNFADVQGSGWLDEAAAAYEARTGARPDFPAKTLQKQRPALRPPRQDTAHG